MLPNHNEKRRHPKVTPYWGKPQKGLFLSALLAYEVGATEDGEDSDARAEGGVLVVRLTVARNSRETANTVSVFEVGVFLLRGVAALEETTAISEGGHAQSEDDCDCQC